MVRRILGITSSWSSIRRPPPREVAAWSMRTTRTSVQFARARALTTSEAGQRAVRVLGFGLDAVRDQVNAERLRDRHQQPVIRNGLVVAAVRVAPGAERAVVAILDAAAHADPAVEPAGEYGGDVARAVRGGVPHVAGRVDLRSVENAVLAQALQQARDLPVRVTIEAGEQLPGGRIAGADGAAAAADRGRRVDVRHRAVVVLGQAERIPRVREIVHRQRPEA